MYYLNSGHPVPLQEGTVLLDRAPWTWRVTLPGHGWEEDGDAEGHCPAGDDNEQTNIGKGVDGRRSGG